MDGKHPLLIYGDHVHFFAESTDIVECRPATRFPRQRINTQQQRNCFLWSATQRHGKQVSTTIEDTCFLHGPCRRIINGENLP
jgi:hypothetical protein